MQLKQPVKHTKAENQLNTVWQVASVLLVIMRKHHTEHYPGVKLQPNVSLSAREFTCFFLNPLACSWSHGLSAFMELRREHCGRILS